MFGEKQRKIKELERKVDGYVAREYRYRQVLDDKDAQISTLMNKLEKYKKQYYIKLQEINDLTEKLKDSDEIKTLKEIRKEKGMTQKQVAEEIGIKSAQYISEIERGIHIPSFRFICKLAELYKVTPAKIVESLTRRLGV